MFFPEFSSIKAGNDAFVFQLQGISLDCAFPDIWPMVWLKAPSIQHLFWENEDEITRKYTEDRVVGLFDPPCFRKMQVDQI